MLWINNYRRESQLKSYEIEERLEKAKNNVLTQALLEANALLAEVHHQVNIIEREAYIVCVEYKRARQAIEQAREYLKMVTIS